jgi:hypothetical protein
MTNAAACAPVSFAHLPPLGTTFEGDVFAGITTRPDGTHCAVVLLGAKPSKRLDWAGAMAWAAEQGAELPARPVSALLFANARGHFEKDWYWTCEAYDGSFAWIQTFGHGFPLSKHKSDEGRARAVRLIPIVS